MRLSRSGKAIYWMILGKLLSLGQQLDPFVWPLKTSPQFAIKKSLPAPVVTAVCNVFRDHFRLRSFCFGCRLNATNACDAAEKSI